MLNDVIRSPVFREVLHVAFNAHDVIHCGAFRHWSRTCSGNQRQRSPARTEVPKVERQGAWQPTSGGEQVPLWPANVALAKPDLGDHPEATGNGSPFVGGRMWHWVSYVTRPTMTIYRPKEHNTGAAMLVIPGGGFHAVATDL